MQMPTSFLTNASPASSATVAVQATTDPSSGKEAIRILVLGSRRGVLNIIHRLHQLGFAQAGEWSPLQPTSTPGQLMSILTRYILLT